MVVSPPCMPAHCNRPNTPSMAFGCITRWLVRQSPGLFLLLECSCMEERLRLILKFWPSLPLDCGAESAPDRCVQRTSQPNLLEEGGMFYSIQLRCGSHPDSCKVRLACPEPLLFMDQRLAWSTVRSAGLGHSKDGSITFRHT